LKNNSSNQDKNDKQDNVKKQGSNKINDMYNDTDFDFGGVINTEPSLSVNQNKEFDNFEFNNNNKNNNEQIKKNINNKNNNISNSQMISNNQVLQSQSKSKSNNNINLIQSFEKINQNVINLSIKNYQLKNNISESNNTNINLSSNNNNQVINEFTNLKKINSSNIIINTSHIDLEELNVKDIYPTWDDVNSNNISKMNSINSNKNCQQFDPFSSYLNPTNDTNVNTNANTKVNNGVNVNSKNNINVVNQDGNGNFNTVFMFKNVYNNK